MAVKQYKPYTSVRRFMTVLVSDEITAKEPYKPLTKGKQRISARNMHGRITMRRRGGGHKKRYRVIDFKRDKHGIEGRIASIEYDPNRSANIALVVYKDGEKRYIIAPDGIKVGDSIIAGENVKPNIGNAMPLANIPVGTIVHNVELIPGRGAKLARSAGSYAQIMSREGKYCILKLPSGEVRMINARCWAVIGQVGNKEHENIEVGKAGRMRWLGRRPKVRGVAMNPVDHPHGGGEGKAPQGNPHPVTPWGKPTKGYKTRKKNKLSNKYILKRRK